MLRKLLVTAAVVRNVRNYVFMVGPRLRKGLNICEIGS